MTDMAEAFAQMAGAGAVVVSALCSDGEQILSSTWIAPEMSFADAAARLTEVFGAPAADAVVSASSAAELSGSLFASPDTSVVFRAGE